MQARFRRLAKDSAVYGIGGMASKFLGFLLLPIYTRVFSPADYGTMDVIATMVALAGIVLTAGTETALSYYFFQLDDELERQKTITSTATYLLLVNGAVALIAWISAKSIAQLVFDDRGFAVFLRIAVLSIPFSSFLSLNLNVLRLLRRPWLYVSLTLSQLIFTIALNIAFVVVLRTGVIGVFWTTLCSSVLFSVIGARLNREFLSLSALDWSRLGQVIRYGLPLVIGGVSMWSINFLDRYFLLHFSSLDQVGLYSVGVKLASAIAFVTWAFRLANAPFQFEVSADPDAPEIYSRTLYYYVLIFTFLAVTVAVFARPALRILTTESYVSAAPVVGILAFSAVAYGIYQIVGVGLLVTKRTGFTGMAIGIGAVANVGFLLLLVPRFGMVGAGVAVLLTHVVVIIFLYRAGQRAYFIPYNLGQVARILIAGFVVVVLGNLITPSTWWIDAIVGAGLLVSFLLLITLLGVVEPTLLKGIRQQLHNAVQ